MGDPVNFNPDDVRRVAEYVQSRSGFDYWDENGDYTPKYQCHLCNAKLEQIHTGGGVFIQPEIKDFRHSPDCLYLVAQDLLTGLMTPPENK